jgi:hypothetical protein
MGHSPSAWLDAAAAKSVEEGVIHLTTVEATLEANMRPHEDNFAILGSVGAGGASDARVGAGGSPDIAAVPPCASGGLTNSMIVYTRWSLADNSPIDTTVPYVRRPLHSTEPPSRPQ